jgi:hypothetical protein
MYLIRTRFASATDHHGARYVVTAIGGTVALPDGRKRMVVPFDYSARSAAKVAAVAFARAVGHGEQRVEFVGAENGDSYWLVTF